jgi:hypothetical protein
MVITVMPFSLGVTDDKVRGSNNTSMAIMFRVSYPLRGAYNTLVLIGIYYTIMSKSCQALFALAANNVSEITLACVVNGSVLDLGNAHLGSTATDPY